MVQPCVQYMYICMYVWWYDHHAHAAEAAWEFAHACAIHIVGAGF